MHNMDILLMLTILILSVFVKESRKDYVIKKNILGKFGNYNNVTSY